MAASVGPSKKQASRRRRRSAAGTKKRGGVQIQAPNLAQAYLLAGLATGEAADHAWQQAHQAVAEAISAAKRVLPTLDATEVDADLDQLLALLAQQRNEARRRYAQETKLRPGGPDAARAKQAADMLDAALTTAVRLREEQLRRERTPAKAHRKNGRRGLRKLLAEPTPQLDVLNRIADAHARRHYGVTIAQLRERDGRAEERFQRNASDTNTAKREVDESVAAENVVPGPRLWIYQSRRPGPTVIPAPAGAGRPPERLHGVWPRSRAARIAAQTADAQRVQDGRRKLQAA